MKEAAAHKDILEHSKGYARYQEANTKRQLEAQRIQGVIADEARRVDAEMRSVDTTIAGLEGRFKRLLYPTESLTHEMNQLRPLMRAVSNASDDQAKIQAYRRLEAAISGCNTKISQMAALERTGFGKETSRQFDKLVKYESSLMSAGLLTEKF